MLHNTKPIPRRKPPRPLNSLSAMQSRIVLRWCLVAGLVPPGGAWILGKILEFPLHLRTPNNPKTLYIAHLPNLLY